LVIGSEAIYCDVIDPNATLPRVHRMPAPRALLDAARAVVPDASVVPIATSARVGGGIACEVEAMEGFGVLRAAELAGVPALEVRVISNPVHDADRGRWKISDALAILSETPEGGVGSARKRRADVAGERRWPAMSSRTDSMNPPWWDS
jgi:futalosine hydrolase